MEDIILELSQIPWMMDDADLQTTKELPLQQLSIRKLAARNVVRIEQSPPDTLVMHWKGSLRTTRELRKEFGPIYDDDNPGYIRDIQEIARADFNNDGIEDILVLATTRAEVGTMRDYEVLLLTRHGAKELFAIGRL